MNRPLRSAILAPLSGNPGPSNRAEARSNTLRHLLEVIVSLTHQHASLDARPLVTVPPDVLAS
jgi:hypothetical protein